MTSKQTKTIHHYQISIMGKTTPLNKYQDRVFEEFLKYHHIILDNKEYTVHNNNHNKAVYKNNALGDTFREFLPLSFEDNDILVIHQLSDISPSPREGLRKIERLSAKVKIYILEYTYQKSYSDYRNALLNFYDLQVQKCEIKAHGRKCKYDESDLRKIYEEYIAGSITFRDLEEKYHIPHATLQFHFSRFAKQR